MTRRSAAWIAGASSTALVVLALLTRGGPARFLDTASYAAAVEALDGGRGVAATLVPSFSDYTAADFVSRGGSVPFVDFPLGHPLVAAVVGLVTSPATALLVVCVACSAASAALVVHGPTPARPDHATYLARAGFAVAMLLLPIHLDVIGAGLSEPLFVCCLLASAVAATSDDPRRLRAGVLLAGVAGAVRFVGLPVVAVPTLLLCRRIGTRRALPWTLVAVAPVVLNALWAAGAGGGHRPGWRGLSSDDVRFTVHSVAGWFSHSRGGFDRLLSGTAWPAPWWSALAVVWMAATAVAVAALVVGRATAHRTLVVPLAMAGTLTVSLVAGMTMFDALVSPDNRLMLPAGILTLTGIVWWAGDRLPPRILAAAVLAWALLAIQPWTVERVTPTPAVDGLVDAVGDARIVVSDDADAVWWATRTPAAYLPLPTRLLTGEPVDQLAEFAPLPCLLHEAQGTIVILGGAWADRTLQPELDRLSDTGDLVVSRHRTVTRYTPTGRGCDDR